MAQNKKFDIIPKFTRNEWEAIGDKSANEMREQIQAQKFFAGTPYTREYRERKIRRKAGRKGVSISSTSGIPDLTLTGKMLQQLKTTKITTKNVFIGWIGAITNIVEGNARNNRDVRDPKLLDIVGVKSRSVVERTLNKHIKRTDGKIKMPIRIRI